MKVLVTGATGGLGGLIIKELLNQGHEVVATSRDAQKAAKEDFFKSVKYISYDFSKPLEADLFEHFERPDALIHPAWEKLNDFRSEEHLTVFLQDHKRFIENLLKNGLKNFNGVGTCYECGLHEGIIDEDTAAVPGLPYAAAKNELRKFTEKICREHHAAYKWIRIFYVFGEVKGRKNLYTLLKEAMERGDKVFNMSPGEQVRDFLSPADIAANIVKIATQNKVQGIVNCCSGKPVKLKEFVADFLNRNHYEMSLNLGFYPYADYEPMVTWGSVEKLNRILKKDTIQTD
jgi:nucleoside-diphosphate-sugar epimerase